MTGLIGGRTIQTGKGCWEDVKKLLFVYVPQRAPAIVPSDCDRSPACFGDNATISGSRLRLPSQSSGVVDAMAPVSARTKALTFSLRC
jgi:hypothetical protein